MIDRSEACLFSMNRRYGAGVAVMLLWTATVVAQTTDPDNCLLCHQYRALSRYDRAADTLHVYYVSADYYHRMEGPHARLACTDCHPRSEVGVVPHQPASRVDCTRTCHLQGVSGVAREFSHAGVVEVLAGSVHAMDKLAAVAFADRPLLDPGQSACLYCHDEPIFRHDIAGASSSLSIFGSDALHRCQTCHADQLGINLEYDLRHIASRLQPARSTLELVQVCAVCHADPTILTSHGLTDTVASYLHSFHGKAALLGAEETASCISCHAPRRQSPHIMLSRTDPRSPSHPQRIAATCSSRDCHPGAAPSLADTSVHLNLPTARGSIDFLLAAAFVILTLLTFGPSLMVTLLELMQVAIGRHSPRDEPMRELAARLLADPRGRQRLVRFSIGQRIQHWVLAGLFILLVLTGFPMKFAHEPWARWMVDRLGGLALTRRMHHLAGVALVLGFLGHVAYYLGLVVVRTRRARAAGQPAGMLSTLFAMPMWITLDDARKIGHYLQYLLLLRDDRPKFGRFSLKEKFEYIGVFWGTMILGVTGIILWSVQVSSHVFSGRVFNLATIAHTYEAFLALIHVGILHIYNVMLSPHVFPLSPATITGQTPVHELADGHAAMVEQVAGELGIRASGETHP